MLQVVAFNSEFRVSQGTVKPRPIDFKRVEQVFLYEYLIIIIGLLHNPMYRSGHTTSTERQHTEKRAAA